MNNETCYIYIDIPFRTNRLAQIAYDVLRVDAEPKRSGIKKELCVKDNVLVGKFSGTSNKQMRVAVNCFFENTSLISKTIELLGPPVSENYSYY